MNTNSDTRSIANDPKIFLEDLGYEITPDSDQPGLWCWIAPTDNCEISYHSDVEALEGAWFDAQSQVMGILDISTEQWELLSFEQQKAKIIEVLSGEIDFDELNPDTQMEWVGKVRVNYPHIGSKEAFRLAKQLYNEEG